METGVISGSPIPSRDCHLAVVLFVVNFSGFGDALKVVDFKRQFAFRTVDLPFSVPIRSTFKARKEDFAPA